MVYLEAALGEVARASVSLVFLLGVSPVDLASFWPSELVVVALTDRILELCLQQYCCDC
jgi:hypothetical protein